MTAPPSTTVAGAANADRPPSGALVAVAYAGVGARATPRNVRLLMTRVATALADRGWVLRTGGAPGADQAFLAGLPDGHCGGEVYLPWPGFEGLDDVRLRQPAPAAYVLAARHHPSWQQLGPGPRALHARNSHVLLGADLASPARFVLCWTPEGSLTGLGQRGGTSQALRVAAAHRIGVINLCRSAHRAFAASFLTRP